MKYVPSYNKKKFREYIDPTLFAMFCLTTDSHGLKTFWPISMHPSFIWYPGLDIFFSILDDNSGDEAEVKKEKNKLKRSTSPKSMYHAPSTYFKQVSKIYCINGTRNWGSGVLIHLNQVSP